MTNAFDPLQRFCKYLTDKNGHPPFFRMNAYFIELVSMNSVCPNFEGEWSCNGLNTSGDDATRYRRSGLFYDARSDVKFLIWKLAQYFCSILTQLFQEQCLHKPVKFCDVFVTSVTSRYHSHQPDA